MWVLAGIAGVLVVGCASQLGPEISDLPAALIPTEMLSPPFTLEAALGLPSTKEGQTVTFTVVYDNNGYDPALRTAWGFSCWVETGEATILFDTGGDLTPPTIVQKV